MDGLLTSFSGLTNGSYLIIGVFGDVICFNTTYKTDQEVMPFGIFSWAESPWENDDLGVTLHDEMKQINFFVFCFWVAYYNICYID